MRFFRTILTLLFALLLADSAAGKKFVLVLDAGHGGHDSGAVGAYSKEKDINLKVTLEVGQLIKANCPDVSVVYTRSTDVFIPLQTRADIANRNKADLFVSIHTNALPKGSNLAYGSETYTLGMARAAANLEVAKRENAVIVYEKNYQQTYEGFDPNKAESYIIFELMQDKYMKQSVDLAKCIQQQYVSAGRRNKGVHQAGFLVLRKTSMPAVLTELGFISTPDEERYLNSSEGVQALARSIYNGIVAYRGQTSRTVAIEKPSLPADDEKNDAPPAPQAANPNKPVVATPQEPAVKETPAETKGAIVFRVQLFVSDRKLKMGDSRLKGLTDATFYRDGGAYKYTYGEETDYTAIRRIQKSIADKFPDTFIVAFKDGQRVNLAEAIRESRKK